MALSNTLAKKPVTQCSVGLKEQRAGDWKDFIVIEEVWKVTNLKIHSTEQMAALDKLWIHMQNGNAEHSCKTVGLRRIKVDSTKQKPPKKSMRKQSNANKQLGESGKYSIVETEWSLSCMWTLIIRDRKKSAD